MKIVIPTSPRCLKLKDVQKTEDEILAIIVEEVSQAKEHFADQEDGGWRLNKSYLLSEVLRKIFKFSIEEELDQAFINAGLHVTYSNNASYISDKDGYKPIYMHKKTNKITVIENCDDTSFLFKYTSKNGYEYIGRL